MRVLRPLQSRFPRWYCVQSHPKMEFVAQIQLRQQGYTTFLPTHVVKDAKRPLLGSYLFVRFDVDLDRWRPIVSTVGVRRLLSASPEHPTPLPDGFIQLMANPCLPVHECRIKPGDSLRVLAGPFQGFACIAASVQPSTVHVFLDIFGRPTSIELNHVDVARV